MLWAVGRLVNPQRALVGFPRPGEIAQGVQHAPQVVDAGGDLRVLRPVGRLINAQDALEGRPRPGEIGHLIQIEAQVVPQHAGLFRPGGFGGRGERFHMRAQRRKGGR
ncbi:MAG: hypothetical protein BWY25_01440 [Chloroflexi bacterium ADurb.Bin222]|nr:MAG: hypothetical protein BWY25_01440 [Chloroflexi bacterium ADurb.Bin222]